MQRLTRDGKPRVKGRPASPRPKVTKPAASAKTKKAREDE